MGQRKVWDQEYDKQKFVSTENKPHADIVRLIRTLKKNFGFIIEDSTILDIGCGTGRNAYHFASLGAHVIGIDISKNAIEIARQNAVSAGIEIDYVLGDIGQKLTIDDSTIDLAIDILASNSINENERNTYVSELHRVLKPGGFFFIRTLAKEGDSNAQYLLKHHSGLEENTYILPAIGLTERVFTKIEMTTLYGVGFSLISLEKKAHYPKIDGKTYKRQFYYGLYQKPL
jgi:SAM-dependent methyltransferase